MSEAVNKNRHKYGVMSFADIRHYRLPLAAYVSILHRASGAMMFVLLPFVLFLLDKSLTSEISFEYLKGFTSNWFVKLVILALVWAYLHHVCAGIRHLLMDVHVGVDKVSGRKSAVTVFAISLPIAALVALKLFGVF
ncbi:succinate dehydrogenase, cytochrome b556 subunit [Noviherbaspirillum denitrificans]|uniref:Succinate dehydrogenase cytochrome b556 subunit n=1 Tax=Noviherbaspirillum denitrificans TaxID=1968433 RepID=A0A254T6C3_9BURK|nr:succinate dehydrogenase, cytochrome b556 subunit [Noviherbaspirillum denitrificans]OWW18200.1 succinate dehydrogenase [Noviherbaspirillum denitrificans]